MINQATLVTIPGFFKMKKALNHQLLIIALSLRGFVLLELEVEVSAVDSTGTSEQLQYANQQSPLSGETFRGKKSSALTKDIVLR